MLYGEFNAEYIQGMAYFTMQYIERPFLKWKDSFAPRSPEQLNKRIESYANTYFSNADLPAIPIIWDAIKNGGSADVLVKTDDGKKEPLIVRAARKNSFFLVQALQAAGAKLEEKGADGQTAQAIAEEAGFTDISSFLKEAIEGAKIEREQDGVIRALSKVVPSFSASAKPVDPAEFDHGAMENKGLPVFKA